MTLYLSRYHVTISVVVPKTFRHCAWLDCPVQFSVQAVLKENSKEICRVQCRCLRNNPNPKFSIKLLIGGLLPIVLHVDCPFNIVGQYIFWLWGCEEKTVLYLLGNITWQNNLVWTWNAIYLYKKLQAWDQVSNCYPNTSNSLWLCRWGILHRPSF